MGSGPEVLLVRIRGPCPSFRPWGVPVVAAQAARIGDMMTVYDVRSAMTAALKRIKKENASCSSAGSLSQAVPFLHTDPFLRVD